MQYREGWSKWSLGIHSVLGFHDQMTSKVSSSSENKCTWNITFFYFKLLHRLLMYFCSNSLLLVMSIVYLMSRLWSEMQPNYNVVLDITSNKVFLGKHFTL